jgi:hypothetical protein
MVTGLVLPRFGEGDAAIGPCSPGDPCDGGVLPRFGQRLKELAVLARRPADPPADTRDMPDCKQVSNLIETTLGAWTLNRL